MDKEALEEIELFEFEKNIEEVLKTELSGREVEVNIPGSMSKRSKERNILTVNVGSATGDEQRYAATDKNGSYLDYRGMITITVEIERARDAAQSKVRQDDIIGKIRWAFFGDQTEMLTKENSFYILQTGFKQEALEREFFTGEGEPIDVAEITYSFSFSINSNAFPPDYNPRG